MSNKAGGTSKAKYDASQKVYEKENYIILKVNSGKKVGYIAYNTKKEWENGHTHLDSFDMAKTIISNVIKHKKPKTKKNKKAEKEKSSWLKKSVSAQHISLTLSVVQNSRV